MSDVNPRAVIGGNTADAPDYSREESDRLRRDYAELDRNVAELIAEADAMPDEIPDDETKGQVASLIKRIRDASKRADGFRDLEGTPHFRRKQGVDQFFFGIIDRLTKRDRKNRDGVADTLQTRLTAYDNRKLMEEQARRRAAAEAAAREEARLRAEAAEKARIAEEARLAAERARKPETTAAKQEVANTAELLATEAAIDATIATSPAEDLHRKTLAKPDHIMNHRGSDGTLSTMAREGYAEVEDAAKLDMAALWPFISLDAKEKALRAWAKSSGHRQMMTGAAIGFRNKSVVR